MKDLLRRWLMNRYGVGAVLALLGVAGWYFLAASPSGNVVYDTAAVERGDIENSVSSSGAVSPILSVTVGAEVSGRLTEVLVDFNSKVKKGQLLAIIDPSTFQTKMRSAEADMVVQQATVGTREVELSNADTNLAQAKRDIDRIQTLFDRGLVSQNELEKSRNAYEQAQNSHKISKANLNNAKSQSVKVRANLEQAQIDLSRTQVHSPVDGVVINRKVDPGQTVAASMSAPELFTIAQDLSQIRIETKVDEADIGSIKENTSASFTVDAYPERSFQGRVAQVRISGTTSQNVVTYSVMVYAENPNQVLLPGMTANVKIITDERKAVLRVPSSALRFRPPGAGGAVAAVAGAAGARSTSATGGAGSAGGGQGMAGNFPGGGFPGGGGTGGQRSGGGGRGASMVELTPEVMKELGLDATQQQRAAEAVATVTKEMAAANSGSSSNPLGGGMPNFRMLMGGNNAQQMRQKIQNALAAVMTPEQIQKYMAMSSGRSGARPGTVYVQGEDGNLSEKPVRVGLSDDNYTEILSGLAEGDKIVLRSRVENS